MALLLAALGMFVAFHFLPFFGGTSQGFHMWLGVRCLSEDPKLINEEPWFVIGMACFLNIALLIPTSPFLTQVWVKSRLAWWLVTILSGLAVTGFCLVFFFIYPSKAQPNWGGWFMLLAPILNFLGLLLARRWREEPRNPGFRP